MMDATLTTLAQPLVIKGVGTLPPFPACNCSGYVSSCGPPSLAVTLYFFGKFLLLVRLCLLEGERWGVSFDPPPLPLSLLFKMKTVPPVHCEGRRKRHEWLAVGVRRFFDFFLLLWWKQRHNHTNKTSKMS